MASNNNNIIFPVTVRREETTRGLAFCSTTRLYNKYNIIKIKYLGTSVNTGVGGTYIL